MEWTAHGERKIYGSPYVDLCLVDVQQPDGKRWEHHVVRLRSVAGVVLVDDDGAVLLMWRHRFITESWGWEIPMGLIESDETPEQAAARELLEETGYRTSSLTRLIHAHPANGITDSEHYIFVGRNAVKIAEPTEMNESDRLEWVPRGKLTQLVDDGLITSSATLVGVLRLLAEPVS